MLRMKSNVCGIINKHIEKSGKMVSKSSLWRHRRQIEKQGINFITAIFPSQKKRAKNSDTNFQKRIIKRHISYALLVRPFISVA